MTTQEKETDNRKPLPRWSYLLPVLFSIFGGIVGWAIFKKRSGSGNLIIVGLIVSFINMVINIVVFP